MKRMVRRALREPNTGVDVLRKPSGLQVIGVKGRSVVGIAP